MFLHPPPRPRPGWSRGTRDSLAKTIPTKTPVANISRSGLSRSALRQRVIPCDNRVPLTVLQCKL